MTVAVAGGGWTDLDLYVYCKCGVLVAKDDDGTDTCLVRFRAPESGIYTLRVKNRGSFSQVYGIVVE